MKKKKKKTEGVRRHKSVKTYIYSCPHNVSHASYPRTYLRSYISYIWLKVYEPNKTPEWAQE